MRRVELEAFIPRRSRDEVFREIVRFDRYPGLAPHVRSAEVRRTRPEPTGESAWELYFRSGVLRWTEQETFQPAQGRILFAQTAGDFDELTGSWTLSADSRGTALAFRADFDFGIPSLAGILDPIAERVIAETIAYVVTGLFDDVRLHTPLDLPVASVPGGVG